MYRVHRLIFTLSGDALPPIERHALAVLLVTSVHHVYGAWIYETPFRLHAVALATTGALVLVAFAALVRRYSGSPLGRWGAWAFVATVLAVPVLLFGAFEGVYNHVLKNALFFGGVSRVWLERLFPPPTYELPNDLVFELTGVLQVVPAVTTLLALLRAPAGAPRRVRAGDTLAPRELTAVGGGKVALPDTRDLVHLQLRRFAGCPVCHRHLRAFVLRHHELSAAGIREVVVFHSTVRDLLAHAGGLPFAVVADPEKRLYRELGVLPGYRALIDPRAWPGIVAGVALALAALVRRRRSDAAARPVRRAFWPAGGFLDSPRWPGDRGEVRRTRRRSVVGRRGPRVVRGRCKV